MKTGLPVVLLVLLAACAGPAVLVPDGGDDVASTFLAGLPATYSGELDCADCAGRFHRFDFFADGAYFYSATDRGQPQQPTVYDVGAWALATDGSRLALRGSGQQAKYFQPAAGGGLRQLDDAGEAIAANGDSLLRQEAVFEQLVPELPLRGMFRYFADAAVFRECLTGQRWPVAMEGEYLQLERAYLERHREFGEELLVSLVGRVELRPPMEGDGVQSTLVVLEYGELWFRGGCEPRFENQSLERTEWVLTGVEGVDIAAATVKAPPDFRLDSAGGVSGFAGCNRYAGGYSVAEQGLTFTPLAATRMACQAGMDIEQTFLSRLQHVARWRISGSMLELLSADGSVLLRFEAREYDLSD